MLLVLVAILRKALVAATEKALSLGAETLSSAATGALVPLSAVSSHFVSKFATHGLETLLSGGVDRLDAKLSRLLAEPMRTGLEQLRIARSISVNGPEDNIHRSDRYRDALRSFDRAFGLATSEEKPFISLLKGMTAVNIPGAATEASLHFVDVRNALQAGAEEITMSAPVQ